MISPVAEPLPAAGLSQAKEANKHSVIDYSRPYAIHFKISILNTKDVSAEEGCSLHLCGLSAACKFSMIASFDIVTAMCNLKSG